MITPSLFLPLADVGVPMLVLQMPALLITLPAVIVIEALLCARRLEISKKDAFKAATLANLLSTVIGFPVLWFVFVLVQLVLGGGGVPNLREPWISIYSVTAQAAWLLPYDNRLYWMIPTAMLVLLIPTFFMSVYVERIIYRKALQKIALDANFPKLSWTLHLASYGLLVALGFGLLVHALLTHHRLT